ncbi:hypothetical protein [Litoreibacter arenae]|uniref:PEP-CTERM protein-sorting domain-containing protein n=1 Tax=Litoreibacter arenae DSM 19593 TaxID=1123360 RepID=S9QA44_9RHOB|nr:hypothetical protein [Litoreibacter arenae]EPX76892.1 hypothetical protein thalar_02610 [Litoreibacter arenae DSM 19593]
MTLNKFKTLCVAASAAALTAFSAQAAPVLYEVNVETEFNSVAFGSAISRDMATGRYQRHTGLSYTDAASSALDGFSWIADARQTTGSLQFVYDEADADAVAPVFSNCTGVLRSLCTGTVTRLAFDATDFSNSDGLSFLTQLGAGSLRYSDDRSYSWDDGTRHFTQMGYGVTVTHDVTSLSIAPVPLPASLGFLLAGLGLLVGARRMSRSKATVG